MTGHGYAVLDMAIGRWGIVLSNAGALGVQLPNMRRDQYKAPPGSASSTRPVVGKTLLDRLLVVAPLRPDT
jgi:hypothetical protein